MELHLPAPLPEPRGPLSAWLLDVLAAAPHDPGDPPAVSVEDPLGDEDLHLALAVAYELHYRGLEGVDDRWEWNGPLLAARTAWEAAFEGALRETVPHPPAPADPGEMDLALRALLDADDAPPLSRWVETRASLDQFREWVVHRSASQLKEADPHSFAIPRLAGRPKAALVEIQSDEYGSGRPERIHAQLFADEMVALGLDAGYGAYLGRLPGVTLATLNLMSLFGLHRRLRGAVVGHLAAYEMGSSIPNRRYANALRRLGRGDATAFHDEHVAADAVHDNIASVDMAGGLAAQDPALAGDVLWGAACLLEIDGRFARHVIAAWERGESSLRSAAPVAA